MAILAAAAVFWPGARTHRAADAVMGSGDSLSDLISGIYTSDKREAAPNRRKREAARQVAAKCSSPSGSCQTLKRAKFASSQAPRPVRYEDGYRTLCVRLCDGFYFPISSSAQPKDFSRDEATCQRRCTSPSKLYVYRVSDGAPEQMVDLEGRPYIGLATAFLHRVAYDQQCVCHAQPWSKEASAERRLRELEASKHAGKLKVNQELREVRAEVESMDRQARIKSGAYAMTATKAVEAPPEGGHNRRRVVTRVQYRTAAPLRALSNLTGREVENRALVIPQPHVASLVPIRETQVRETKAVPASDSHSRRGLRLAKNLAPKNLAPKNLAPRALGARPLVGRIIPAARVAGSRYVVAQR